MFYHKTDMLRHCFETFYDFFITVITFVVAGPNVSKWKMFYRITQLCTILGTNSHIILCQRGNTLLVFGLEIKFVEDVILDFQFQMMVTLCILAWASIHLCSAFSEDIKGKTRSKTVQLDSNL